MKLKLFEEFVNEMTITKAGEEAAKELKAALTAAEIKVLVDFYKKEGKEAVAKQLANVDLEEDTMSPEEIKVRRILDKIITYGSVASMAALLPAAMAGAPFVALGLGIAALVGSTLKDAAWWSTNGHHYEEQDKYGIK
jgi:hypothetical protein